MTTILDAQMQDFSVEGTMDADMLPSASSDADWSQVENMMEDGEAQKPHAEEIDMDPSDVQEFEMRDAADADVDFGGDFDHMFPDDARLGAEPQDQEIPDASRAPSPSAIASSSQHQALLASMGSNRAPEEPSSKPGPQSEVPQIPALEPSTSHQDDDARETPSTHSAALPNEQVLYAEVVETTAADGQETSTISGESTHSPHPHAYDQTLGESNNSSQLPETAEHAEKAGNPAELVHVKQNEELRNEDSTNVEGEIESEPRADTPTETRPEEVDEESLLMDPPPSVLLFYAFDNARFAFFNLPDDSRIADSSAASTLEAPPKTDNPIENTADAQSTVAKDRPSTPPAEHRTQSDAPILLFRDSFALYYEPLSYVFEALRANNAFNTDGRFDHHIELVISVPALDLTLPEDNIHTREVSLHDLGVLHNGCDIPGPLSLRLETISPRFGSRYKAIRDEIVRVVSQQEDEEQPSQSDPRDGFVNGASLHEPPEDQIHEKDSYEQSVDHDHTELGESSGENHPQSEQQQPAEDQGLTHETGVSDSQQLNEPQDQPETYAYEDSTSGEYIGYEEYSEAQLADGIEEAYEDADGDYIEDEGDNFEGSYEDGDTRYYVEEQGQHADEQPLQEAEEVDSVALEGVGLPLEIIGQSFDDIYEPAVWSEDDQVSAVEATGERELPSSPHYVAVEESTTTLASTSDAATNGLTVTPKSQARLFEAVELHDSVPHDNIFSHTEPLLSEAKSRSRSQTPRPPADFSHGPDEVIAYEDAVEGEEDLLAQAQRLLTDPSFPVSTNPSAHGSRAGSTSSKRSYEQHELDQLDGSDSQGGPSIESKRLRVD